MKKHRLFTFFVILIVSATMFQIVFEPQTATAAPVQQVVLDDIQLKPYRVLIITGTQMRDDYVIHNAWDLGDIAALLKLWGVPFDVLRLDSHSLALQDFLDASGQAKYGTIIWTARQDQYPWQDQEYTVLAQAVNDYDISLIAIGNKIQEPVIQELLGLAYDSWGAISDPVTISSTSHFISRDLVGTMIPASEAFNGGNGPRVNTVAPDVETLATAGSWPQLTSRTLDIDQRTRAVWIGGHPDYVFHVSPAFIQILQRSLVWSLDYGVYKDYGHSIVLRVDDPGGAQTAYLGSWHYPQLGQDTIQNSIITPLEAHNANLGVGFNAGYPWIPTQSITRSIGLDFVDPHGIRQNIVSTYAGLLEGLDAGVLEIQSHGLTHMVPDLDTPISGSTNWWNGSIGGEWDVVGWYREFYDTRRGREIDAATQTARLVQSADWIEQDFGQRPLIFIPGGHAISGDRFEGSPGASGTVTITLQGATPDTTYTAYYGGPPWTTLGTFLLDSNGDGQGVFSLPSGISGTTNMYFTINREGTGTQFIAGPILEPLSYNFDLQLRDYTQMTAEELAQFYLADETFGGGSVVGSSTYFGPHIAENYTYKLAGEAGYGLALDTTSHYLGKDYVITLGACTTSGVGNIASLQDNFDRGVPAVSYFHDRDIHFNANYLSNWLNTIDATWPDAYYLSMNEWVGYMHTQIDAGTPASDSIQFDFTYDASYGRYFDQQLSHWTLHLSDELLYQLQSMGEVQILVDDVIVDTVNAAAYFSETQDLTVPAGIATHTIRFQPAGADLSVVKTASSDSVSFGNSLIYTVTVANHGPMPAADVILTDTLPADATPGLITSSHGNCSGTDVVTCDIGSLSSDASANITMIVTPTVPGIITNTASVSSSNWDADTSNNVYTLTSTVNPIVYAVIAIDTENGDICWYPTQSCRNDPNPEFDTRHYKHSDPEASTIFSESFRDAHTDSFGEPFKMSWYAEMDYQFEVATYRDESPDFPELTGTTVGYTGILDTLQRYWGNEIQQFDDGIYWHHHVQDWTSAAWERNGAVIDGYNRHYEALNDMLIDRSYFPSMYRAGWLWEDSNMNVFLNDWIPFDYTTNSGNWAPYHPNVSNPWSATPPNLERWMTRCDSSVNQSNVNTAFSEAQSNGAAIYCLYFHDRDNMPALVENMHSALNNAAAAYPNVQFKYVNALDGIQTSLGFTDRTPPALNINRTDISTYQITANEPVWQDTPYVAAKYTSSNGDYYEHIDVLPVDSDTWQATIPPQMIITPPPPPPIQYEPVTVTASGEHTAAGGAATNAVDGSLSTYWDSAIDLPGGGHGGQVPAWIQLELDDVETVTDLDIHFYDGDSRQYTYYVESSTDGSTWTEIVTSDTVHGLVTHTFDPPIDLQFIRITVTDNTQNDWAHIREIRLYGESSLVEVNPASATASSWHSPDWPPDNAIDGNDATWWDSGYVEDGVYGGQVPAWLEIDLGEATDISQFSIHFYDTDDRSYEYNVTASSDGNNWVELIPSGTWGQGNVTHELDNHIFMRYLHINVTDSTTGNPNGEFAHIMEVRFFAEGEPPSPQIYFLETVGAGASDVYGNPSTALYSAVSVDLEVFPATHIVPAGEATIYTAMAHDAQGYAWDVTASTSFTISSNAGGIWNSDTYTSEVAGAWTVTGNYGSLTDTATLTVQPAPAIHIEVSPITQTVTAGDAVIYQVLAEDEYSNTWDATSETNFSIEPDAQGTWTDNTYTSEIAGTWTVTATLDGLTTTAALTVEHAAAVSIELAPVDATVTAGDNITYQATARDAYGNTWDVTTETEFSIETGAGGTWADHVYSGEIAGTWTVTGDFDGLTATATLTVEHATAIAIEITPAEATVTAGDDTTYQAVAQDAFGNTWDVTAETAFSIDTGAGGTWTDNVYTSEAAGTWTVTGDYDGLTDTATLTVQHADAVAIDITPAEATITAGDDTTYQAVAQDAFGNTRDVTAETAFSIDTGAGGVWTDNVYTSEIAGTWTVTGDYDGITDSATLIVEHADAVAIEVTPDPATVTAGDDVVYEAMAQDAYGNTWDVTADSSFAVQVGAGGTWADNVYTTELAGDWTVTGSYDDWTDTAQLHVIEGNMVSITITPSETSVTAGESVTYQVTAQDEYGNPWDVTAQTSFTIELAAGGTWVNNVYQSELAGTWTITGSFDDLTGNAVLTVQHAEAIALTLTPAQETVSAGDAVTYQVIAQDAFGNAWDVTTETAFGIDAAAGGNWIENVYTAELAGTWTVTGTLGALTCNATLVVQHAEATAITVTPTEETVVAGDALAYQAIAQDAFDNTWDVTTETNFSIDAGAGGSWADNVYTGEVAGTWTVTGRSGALAGTATLTVQHATAVTLQVSPEDETIVAGTSVTYQSTAQDAFGNTWDTTTGTVFSLDAAAAGSWSDNVYTAELAGTWRVTAVYGDLEANASLTVQHAAAAAIEITPSETSVTAGDSVAYQTTARDAFSNSWDATSETSFSINAGAGGLWDANVYTSEVTGNWTVTAAYDSRMATARLHVQPAPAPEEHLVFVPFVANRHVPPAPDLIVEEVSVSESGVLVTIKNQGTAPVTDAFWVDLYVDPNPVPTGVNQTWNDGRCTQGIVWGVTETALPLAPGQSLTLALDDAYYWPEYSNFTGSLPAGTPIYVQVDSANTDTAFGAVLESHEITGAPYNNILGPLAVTFAIQGGVENERMAPANGHATSNSQPMPSRP